MMIAERKKEMGIMVALGMKKIRLCNILLIETILIGMLGVALGFLFSVPFINYFFHHPIPITGTTAEIYMKFGFEPMMYFSNDFSLDFSISNPLDLKA